MKRMLAVILSVILTVPVAAAFGDGTIIYRYKSGLIAAEAVDEGEGGDGGENEPQAWITLSDAVLPAAVVGQAWAFDFLPFLASQGVNEEEIQWGFGEEGGPAGLAILATGTVSGYPVMPGIQPFEVVASVGGVEGRHGFVLEAALGVGWIDLASTSASSTTCGLKEGGMAWCWGANTNGVLGIGDADVALSHAPVQVRDNVRLTTIQGGGSHFCGLDAAGSAWCWGRGENGQLGQADEEDRAEPVMVMGEHAFHGLAVGYEHSCGLKTNGEAWCWGRNYGSSPSFVSGHHFEQISAGADHTCGVKSDRSGWCWGATNAYGELGTGAAASMIPTAVSGGHSFDVIEAGHNSTCGVLADGTGMCWGRALDGKLGTGSLAPGSVLQPTAVHGGYSFARIEGPSYNFTCGITIDGLGLCWGRGNNGRLGNGSASNSTTPALIAGGHLFQRIATAVSHACGLRVDGAILCWGWNAGGGLGNPEITESLFEPGLIADPA